MPLRLLIIPFLFLECQNCRHVQWCLVYAVLVMKARAWCMLREHSPTVVYPQSYRLSCSPWSALLPSWAPPLNKKTLVRLHQNQLLGSLLGFWEMSTTLWSCILSMAMSGGQACREPQAHSERTVEAHIWMRGLLWNLLPFKMISWCWESNHKLISEYL